MGGCAAQQGSGAHRVIVRRSARAVHARRGPIAAWRPSRTRARCRRPDRHVGHQQQGERRPVMTALRDRIGPRRRVGRPARARRAPRGPGRPGRSTAVSVLVASIGPFGRCDQHVLVGPGDQVLAQPLAVALADPPARGELVGVPGDAGGRELCRCRRTPVRRSAPSWWRRPRPALPRTPTPARPPAHRPGTPRAERPSTDRRGPRRGPGRTPHRGLARAECSGRICRPPASLSRPASAICTAALDVLAHRRRSAPRCSSAPRPSRRRPSGWPPGQLFPQHPDDLLVDLQRGTPRAVTRDTFQPA